jgi:hypothetical protein
MIQANKYAYYIITRAIMLTGEKQKYPVNLLLNEKQ